MLKNYESPEAIEIGNADSIILGEKDDDLYDQPTLSFVRTIQVAIDVDE